MVFGDLVKGGIEGFSKLATDILKEFHVSPEKLMELEQAGQRLANDLTLGLERIAADDRNSAREREKAVKDKTPAILMYSCTAGFFGILAYMLGYDVPQGNERILDMMLGSLGTAWIMGWAYYFGSSSGSAAKTHLISKMTMPKPDEPPPLMINPPS